MSALPEHIWSEAEYLAFERESDIRHEFWDGQIRAMAGASRRHNIIASNVNGVLFNQLADRTCEHYPGDMRVYVSATRLFTYPDVTMVCGDVELNDEALDALLNPTVIFEILSPSTEQYDRGQKFQAYRSLPSLQDYVLVSQAQARVEHYHRQGTLQWAFTDILGLDTAFTLPSIRVTLPLADLYRKVNFEDE